MIDVRPENQDDYAAIANVNRRAFDGESESKLIWKLRRSKEFSPELSLVACEKNRIVGHILFSPVTIEGAGGAVPALSLAPMAVLPEFQRRGIGSLLVHEGLERAREAGYGAVIVIGHPEYYPRFGFSPAALFGLRSSFPVPDEAFMALELREGYLRDIHGTVVYPEAFASV